MVLNCHVEIDHINPVRMDVIGSWVTDLVWDKLTRVGLDGEAAPWAAESFKWVTATPPWRSSSATACASTTTRR